MGESSKSSKSQLLEVQIFKTFSIPTKIYNIYYKWSTLKQTRKVIQTCLIKYFVAEFDRNREFRNQTHKSKEEGTDQEPILLNTTPDPGLHMGE